MPGGGYRNPTSIETLKMKKRDDGSIRSDEHGAMDGAAVFNFSITDVPLDIQNSVKRAQATFDDHLGKFRVLGEKAIARVNRVGP